MRLYFENFAKGKGLDPLRAKTWYQYSEEFAQTKVFFIFYCYFYVFIIILIVFTQSAKTILGKFKGGYYQALKHLFPEIKFNIKFLRRMRHNNNNNKRKKELNFIYIAMWHNVENRRKFFEEYAQENGFDPLVPDEWYLQSRERIIEKKV